MANIAKPPSSLNKPNSATKPSAPPASAFAPKTMHVPGTITKTPVNTPAPIVKPAPLVPPKAIEQDLPKAEAKAASVGIESKPSLASAPKATRAERPVQVPRTSLSNTGATAILRKFIIDGRMTDDEVLEQIKAGFGLDVEGRKALVAWYRKHLVKSGQ
jgi:hypothetical protein